MKRDFQDIFLNLFTTVVFTQVVFLALKLTGYTAWSWFQVLLPAIIGYSVVIIVFLIVEIISIIERIRRK